MLLHRATFACDQSRVVNGHRCLRAQRLDHLDVPGIETRGVGITYQERSQYRAFARAQLHAKKAAHGNMPARHTYIAWVQKHVVHHNRCANPKYRLQYADALYRAKVTEVPFNARCRARDSRQVEDDFIVGFIAIFARNLWNEEKRGVLSGCYLAGCIGNHLQQTLQIKFGGERGSDAVELFHRFRPLL